MMLPKQTEEISLRVKEEQTAMAKQLVRIMQELDDLSQQLEEMNLMNESSQQVRLS